MHKPHGFWRITFDTNPDDCNLNCIMCETHSKFNRKKRSQPRRIMDIDLIKKVLLESKNSSLREIIPSTMGEPLLYKNFSSIISMCQEFGLKLNLTTNGTFSGKTVIEWAELLVPITSDVKISFNGATKKTQEAIMRGSNFDQCIQNIKEFIAYRNLYAKNGGNYCHVTLQLTFLQNNVDELENITELAIKLGIDRIKGHHVWAHYPEIAKLSMRQNFNTINHWNQIVKEVQEKARDKILLENFTLLENQATENLTLTGICPFLTREAWVAYDGRFSPCCAPDELRKTLGDFGNLYETSLQDIYHSDNYQKLCKSYMQNKLCISCNMRREV